MKEAITPTGATSPSYTSECIALINYLPPRPDVMTENKVLGIANDLLDKQYGNQGASTGGASTGGGGAKKWCGIRSTINIHAKAHLGDDLFGPLSYALYSEGVANDELLSVWNGGIY